MNKIDINRTYVFRGREVKLTGRVAKSTRSEYMYELSPVSSEWVEGDSKWASLHDLSIISARTLNGFNLGNATTHDYTYLNLLRQIMENGVRMSDRTGTGTISEFAKTMSFDLSDGSIPLLTTKKMHIHSILHEIIWYLSGSTNIQYLRDNNVRIWNEWATEDGELGPIYGPNWRNWEVGDGKHVDQIQDAIDTIVNIPHSRRIIVESWNPKYIPDETLTPQENVEMGKGALPPCHKTMQFSVKEGQLDLMMYQRSADMFLGVPFNIAQYSIFLHIIAHITKTRPGIFTWVGGDVHIYNNHFDQVSEQLTRVPFSSPKFVLNRDVSNIDDLKFEDMDILNYESHSVIPAKVST